MMYLLSFARRVSIGLWIVQALLAAFFVLASGGPKLLLPAEALPMPIPLPQGFVWFIGVCEVSGGLGLVLPGLARVRPRLTVAAAACLALLTICAAAYQWIAHQPGNAAFAVGVGLLAVLVAYGRWRVAPLTARRAPRRQVSSILANAWGSAADRTGQTA